MIISGPSGVGKSTICKEVVKRLDAYLSISVTTRPRGAEEVDGLDYIFLSKDEFQQRIENDGLLEYAEVFDNLYGTPRDKVEEALAQDKDVILEIDVQGALQVRKKFPKAVMVFILPPSQSELANRLIDRGRDDEKINEIRLNGAGTEIAAAWQYYDHMVVNEDLTEAVNEVTGIIQSSSIGEKYDRSTEKH